MSSLQLHQEARGIYPDRLVGTLKCLLGSALHPVSDPRFVSESTHFSDYWMRNSTTRLLEITQNRCATIIPSHDNWKIAGRAAWRHGRIWNELHGDSLGG